MNSSLYSTIITHERFHDLKHKFKYYALSIFIDQDELIKLTKKLAYFHIINLIFFLIMKKTMAIVMEGYLGNL